MEMGSNMEMKISMEIVMEKLLQLMTKHPPPNGNNAALNPPLLRLLVTTNYPPTKGNGATTKQSPTSDGDQALRWGSSMEMGTNHGDRAPLWRWGSITEVGIHPVDGDHGLGGTMFSVSVRDRLGRTICQILPRVWHCTF